ncbi:hypothetical protein EX30DRAFT_398017 [Ascodesmis nigricans]|uniref:VWFA domain-containing protein n=1 Tax=Ascodesmis nigricans TaxID=341454 RepID=A0A4S2MRZ3_9PEZI|nr:hypothetical protein EX30DRAFT_398017 [Ascodesmis nigricans]
MTNPMTIYIPDHGRQLDLSQQNLRRKTPSLPVFSYSMTSRNPEHAHRVGPGYSPFPPPTPFPLSPSLAGTPKPLNYTKNVKHSPSLPLRSEVGSSQQFSSDSLDDHSEVDWRFVQEHKQQQLVQKAAADLERRQSMNVRTSILPSEIAKKIPPRKASVSKKMSWLPRSLSVSTKERHSVEYSLPMPPPPPPPPSIDNGEGVPKKSKSKNLKNVAGFDARKNRTRALSESVVIPAAPTPKMSSEARPVDMTRRRVSSSSSYGKKIKEKIELFAAKSTSSGTSSNARSNRKKSEKKWKHHIFQKDKTGKKGQLQQVSLESVHSQQTVITRRSRTESSGIGSVATAPSQIVAEDSISHRAWQVDGTGVEVDVQKDDGFASLPERALSDSVVGVHDGRMGGRIRKERYFRPWKPPVLELKMQVVADIQRIPVTVKDACEVWIAVNIEGKVAGEADLGKTSRLGLDVGVLMDLSVYTSADAFEEMKNQAKLLVDAMDTTMDRVAVMTFSAPPFGKRNQGSRGRVASNMKVLNSSGSVAKKQLIADIDALRPGLRVDPSTRDVSGAVLAGIRALHQMPLDTNKYGSHRSGHLFLITSKLGAGEITGEFGGVRVHVIGVGQLCNPSGDTGCDGWCLSSFALNPNVEPNLSDIPVGYDVELATPSKDSDALDIPRMLNLIRIGVDVGAISQGTVLLKPGSGCRIKGILGDTNFARLLPGERRHLLIKIAVGDLEEWPEDNTVEPEDGVFDFDELERQLEATLGELKSTILNVQIRYTHSLLGAETAQTPLPDVMTSADVVVSRFVEDSVWSSSRSVASNNFALEDDEELCHHFMQTHLIPNLASTSASASAMRTILEHLNLTTLSTVMRELQHRQWIENTFGRLQSPGNHDFTSPFNADGHCASSGADVFEALFYPNTMPGSSTTVSGSTVLSTPRKTLPNTPTSASPTSPSASRTTISPFSALRTVSEKHTYGALRGNAIPAIRRRTPDEARKLWMKLGGYEDSDEELELEAVAGSGAGSEDESEDGNRRGRNSETSETLVTLRNVRETDFPPWVV